MLDVDLDSNLCRCRKDQHAALCIGPEMSNETPLRRGATERRSIEVTLDDISNLVFSFAHILLTFGRLLPFGSKPQMCSTQTKSAQPAASARLGTSQEDRIRCHPIGRSQPNV
jgi:hypothetical protein